MSIEGQGYFSTLAQGRVHSKIQTGFSQKLLCRSEPNFVWELSGTRKWKFDDMMLVTWPRWPPRPYMVKKLQNLLLWNQQADFHETWYVALGTPAHHSYAPNFEKVGDILVSACPYVCSYVMLCYVLLCYVMLCYVMLCYVMLCYVWIPSWNFMYGFLMEK